MDSNTKKKVIIVSGILLTLGTLSITAIYLPYYADIQKPTQNTPQTQTKSASMWKNIDKISKGES